MLQIVYIVLSAMSREILVVNRRFFNPFIYLGNVKFGGTTYFDVRDPFLRHPVINGIGFYPY